MKAVLSCIREVRNRGKKEKFLLSVVVLIGSFIFLSAAWRVFRHFYTPVVIVTPSIGHRFVICEVQEPRKIERGDLISFIYDGPEFPLYHLTDGTLLLKYVWGLPGDKLTVDSQYVKINGQILGRVLHTDCEGRPVDYFHYAGIIPPGKYFVMGTIKRSFDSRYWGFVDARWHVRKCYPIF
ncbi:S26 family signal peptidase [Desulfurobacterium sp.]